MRLALQGATCRYYPPGFGSRGAATEEYHTLNARQNLQAVEHPLQAVHSVRCIDHSSSPSRLYVVAVRVRSNRQLRGNHTKQRIRDHMQGYAATAQPMPHARSFDQTCGGVANALGDRPQGRPTLCTLIQFSKQNHHPNAETQPAQSSQKWVHRACSSPTEILASTKISDTSGYKPEALVTAVTCPSLVQVSLGIVSQQLCRRLRIVEEAIHLLHVSDVDLKNEHVRRGKARLMGFRVGKWTGQIPFYSWPRRKLTRNALGRTVALPESSRHPAPRMTKTRTLARKAESALHWKYLNISPTAQTKQCLGKS